MKSLLILASLVTQAPVTTNFPAPNTPVQAPTVEVSTVDVGIDYVDFYDKGHKLDLNDMFLTATNTETGDVVNSDRDGRLVLVPGSYTITGQDNFCFVSPAVVAIAADTTAITLEVGCE